MCIGNYIKSMYYTEILRLESKWQVWFSKTIFPDPFGEPKLFVPGAHPNTHQACII